MFRPLVGLALAAPLISHQSMADTHANAIALFEWAETQYPVLLSPADTQAQEIQGFYARYYADNDVYLGVQGDDIWALGPSLGSNID